eukprot:TRINITY_DN3548_c0_g1_i1.p1 TRINITY_DN3548_c0_g1~~TRINITY_DN3548_c0_g1_i1.p1  ORF type:complete len:278 (-),score=62.56 TRINITY_DN3548_c0_g1_i1:120-953(-)
MVGETVVESILRILRENPNGAGQDDLIKQLPGVPLEKLGGAINDLSLDGKIQIGKVANGVLWYKEVKVEEAGRLKGLNQEETILYHIIEAAGNMGIWSRDCKIKSNIPQTTITKILKTLETKKLIKTHQSVTSGTARKVYMLAHLDPHVDISGDIWYNGSEIDTDFIDKLQTACYQQISKKHAASVEELTAFVRKSGISKVELKISNVQSIVDTLEFDGRIEKTDINSNMYRLSKLPVQPNGFTKMPCGTCPVINECSEEGRINPKTCEYYQKWLGF